MFRCLSAATAALVLCAPVLAASPPACVPTGAPVVVRATMKIDATTFDGGCKRYVAGPELGDGGQGEAQKALFRVMNGGTLKNVVIGSPAADGVHSWGNATLQNVHWEDVGEDAFSIKKAGNVLIDGGSAYNADDKVFQLNAEGSLTVRNFVVRNAGKMVRQNGGKTFKNTIVLDNIDVSDMKEAIARTDSPVTTVRMVNSRYRNVGQKWIGFGAGNVSESNNVPY
jgi:pectate lyase C